MLRFNSAASSRSVPLKRIVHIEYTPSLIMGYGALWHGENPANIDTDLDSSFPQRGAIFETNVPKNWFTWKENRYETRGVLIRFGL